MQSGCKPKDGAPHLIEKSMLRATAHDLSRSHCRTCREKIITGEGGDEYCLLKEGKRLGDALFGVSRVQAAAPAMRRPLLMMGASSASC